MPTTREDIRQWLKEAKPEHTHMIVVCDSFSYEDYPVYVSGDIYDQLRKYNDANNMQRVMEVYNLSQNLEQQLKATRAYNI